MRPSIVSLELAVLLVLAVAAGAEAHLCDNVFRQADKLIVKPETYNIVVKDKTTFKIFLQNNMDRGIADIKLIPESPAFEFSVTPAKMRIAKNARVFFEVTMSPKKATRTGKYPIKFRLVGGKGDREFKSFDLRVKGDSGGSAPAPKAERKPSAGAERGKKAPLLKVARAAVGVVVDGDLEDACWKTAGILSNFSAGGGRARHQTIGLVAYDREALHLGFMCMYDTTKDMSEDDKLVIKLSRGGRVIYSFVIPLAGDTVECTRTSVSGTSAALSAEEVKYFSKTGDRSCVAEVSIPFSLLQAKSPGTKEEWHLRVERAKSSGVAERSYWAADSSGYNSEKGLGEILMVGAR